MKNFDLSLYGVEEMTGQEMMEIDGGNIFKDIVTAVVTVIEAVVDWIVDNCYLNVTYTNEGINIDCGCGGKFCLV
jgi:hypothetical protein